MHIHSENSSALHRHAQRCGRGTLQSPDLQPCFPHLSTSRRGVRTCTVCTLLSFSLAGSCTAGNFKTQRKQKSTVSCGAFIAVILGAGCLGALPVQTSFKTGEGIQKCFTAPGRRPTKAHHISQQFRRDSPRQHKRANQCPAWTEPHPRLVRQSRWHATPWNIQRQGAQATHKPGKLQSTGNDWQ